MKCKFCGKKTNWDNSVGRETFIVCNHCVDILSKDLDKRFSDILMPILEIGIYKEIIDTYK